MTEHNDNNEHIHTHDCDCGCNGHDEELDVEMITLTNDDGEEINCIILGVFDVEGKEYMALMPEGDEEDEDEGVLLFRYTESPDDPENVILDMIEDDDEFEKVSNAFNEYFEEQDEEYDYETEDDKE